MTILKRENAWVWILLYFIAGGAAPLFMGVLLNVYDKNAWYAKWENWLIGFLCLVFPVFIMAAIFTIQITVAVASKLNVPTKEIYSLPYVWVCGLIVPIIGWAFIAFYLFYINIMIIINLFNGEGEKYI